MMRPITAEQRLAARYIPALKSFNYRIAHGTGGHHDAGF